MYIELAVALGLGVVVALVFLKKRRKSVLKAHDGWWGVGACPQGPEDDSIRPFRVETTSEEIEDLHRRLDQTRSFPSLEDSQFNYGFNSKYLEKVVSYWRNDFNWRKQVDKLNKYPHFKTKIEEQERGTRAVPLMIVHGWPGSFYEFYGMIPLLTEPSSPDDITFEIICPSIPGYGFSEAPHKKGFDSVCAAHIFNKLMKRLGFSQYYVQGGDWGSLITTNMAQLEPNLWDSLKPPGFHPKYLKLCSEDERSFNRFGMTWSLHINFAPPSKGGLLIMLSILFGRQFPKLFGFTEHDVKRLFPTMEKLVVDRIRATGYVHIQATKPDTAGRGLNDSPVGLAAYILEKFSTWTDPEFKNLEDGGLERKFSLDDLLTNVMIYWTSGSIISSMRFYKENFSKGLNQPHAKLPVYVPTGVASFPNELTHSPKSWVTPKYYKLKTYTPMARGGHFAAMEEPQLLAEDVQNFVKIVEKREKK